MHKGRHLLVDCRGVAESVCLDDKSFLEAMARSADRAGANVISQLRYRFGQDSPPGFAAICMLDESHVSAHSYANLGLIALDIFTCGDVDPNRVLQYLGQEVGLGEIEVREVERFTLAVEQTS